MKSRRITERSTATAQLWRGLEKAKRCPMKSHSKGSCLVSSKSHHRAFFQQFWEKAPGQKWEKVINLTSKLGEINDIEHKKGSKIYPQIQVILDCIMPSIPLKLKCLSIILIWAIVTHKFK